MRKPTNGPSESHQRLFGNLWVPLVPRIVLHGARGRTNVASPRRGRNHLASRACRRRSSPTRRHCRTGRTARAGRCASWPPRASYLPRCPVPRRGLTAPPSRAAPAARVATQLPLRFGGKTITLPGHRRQPGAERLGAAARRRSWWGSPRGPIRSRAPRTAATDGTSRRAARGRGVDAIWRARRA